MQFVDDRELVRQYLDGKESAFEALVARHKNKIFTYILLIVKDESLAEDIFQDTFIKVINTLKRGKYNEEGKFLPWVMRIAHNLSIDHFRKAGKMPKANPKPSGDDEDYDIFSTIKISDPNVEDTLISDQIKNDLMKLLELLPEEQKEVVWMRHFARMSFKEIAEQSNVSINTALGRMRYALINLRKLMKEKGVELTIY